MVTVPVDDERIGMLSPVVRRFLRYVQIDTRSDPDSNATPSTEKQKDLARVLVSELLEAGIENAVMDEFGYVFGSLPAVGAETAPRLGLLAHVDTSPDEPGRARPLVHFDYDGSVVRLPEGPGVVLDPSRSPQLSNHIGEHLITGDGSSLLGSDDKAGVAVLMQLASDIVEDRHTPRPEIRFCFTVDEEIGRGVDKLSLDRFAADVAYTVDGGGTGTLYAETFHAAEAVVDVRGVMVHPGYAKDIMVNALRILSRLIALLPAGEAPETTAGRDGYIHPHEMNESDPAYARAKIILRDFSPDGLERRKRLLASLVEAMRIEHPKAQLTLQIVDQYKNMRSYIQETDRRVVSFAHAAASTIGLPLEEKLVRGGTDGARLSEMGIPTPNVFNGGHDFHSRFEWNTVQNLELSLRYVKALIRYWGEHGSG